MPINIVLQMLIITWKHWFYFQIFVTSQHIFSHSDVNENTQVVQQYPWLIQRTNYRLQCTSCGIPVLQCNRCTCQSERFCSECTRVLTPSYQTLLPGTIMEYWCSCVEKTPEINHSDPEFNLHFEKGTTTFDYPAQIVCRFVFSALPWFYLCNVSSDLC
jgi:hypothetical protein